MDLSIVQSPRAGVELVQVLSSTLPGEIEAGDLLRIDFEQRSFASDGLYVLRVGEWTGVRRISDTLGGLRILDINEWRPLGATVTILGRVEAAFTSRRLH
ncbi:MULTISPECIES: hypothetical protein [unclassified Variovorax]|uniref:hypothetical protein n=1 Tax=unclassified Variovorax TaxID=663243 RepID=UPI0034E8888A